MEVWLFKRREKSRRIEKWEGGCLEEGERIQRRGGRVFYRTVQKGIRGKKERFEETH